LKSFRKTKAEQVKDRRCRIDQAGRTGNADLVFNQAWSRDHIRNMNIFVVDEKGMTEVALVLAESFAMVAKKNKECVPVQISHPQPAQQFTQRLISIMQGVQITV